MCIFILCVCVHIQYFVNESHILCVHVLRAVCTYSATACMSGVCARARGRVCAFNVSHINDCIRSDRVENHTTAYGAHG